MNWRPVVLIGLICVSHCLSQNKESLSSTNPCIGQKTCGDCVAAGKDCAWCQALNYNEDNQERCNLKTEHTKCLEKDLIFPISILERIVDNMPKDGSKNTNPIQLQPQVIHLKLKPNDPQKFNVTFRLANNYPLDLYYLMDLSYSMKDDKEKLALLADFIAQEINVITANFSLGFGSFVEKVAMPYVNTAPDKINTPCPGCEPAYGFKNQLSLSNNSQLFKDKVRAANISENLDAPEGGLDAVMQAIACEKEIGWRTPSRRMLLYSTDAGFHFAGDGKLVGIIKPNDGLCHVVNNIYTESTTQDYPSISQIADKIVEKNVNLIFAVTDKQVKAYEQLKNFIPGSETGTLASDSANIVELVKTNYRKITSKVQMSSTEADDVIVRYRSKCLDVNGKMKDTHVCEGLNIGNTVTFEVEVEVKECPKNSAGYSRKFYIKPVGLADKLEIQMEIICQCDCENNQTVNQNKQHVNCNQHGTFVCGTCNCDDKYYGKTCNCSAGNITQTKREEQCIAPNSALVCSGKGECVCDTCDCKSRGGSSGERYSGKWCQCDDFSCPFDNQFLCGGPTHGRCKCGMCECTSEFIGENCGCSRRNDSCVASDGSICGGPNQGRCECNKCVCNPDGKYQGTTCEDCKDCTMVCRQNKACVQCIAYGTGELKDKCKQECGNRDITVKPTLPDGFNSCEFKDDDECIFYFTYDYDKNNNNQLKIVAQATKECPVKVNVGAIVGGVIGGIVLAGVVALIIWKVVTDIKDRRELAKFEKDVANAEFAKEENPIFKPATRTYKNPTYSGKK